MPRNCRCGGRLKPHQENPIYFKVKCDNCGKVIKQRKRLYHKLGKK